VIGNFLANALKFTAAGEIVLRALRPGPGGAGDGEQVRIEVQDTGPGIAREARARLFQPFSQADESTTRRFGGTGLGLSICRELATLMGGEVGVVSEPGHGSCFWLAVPLPEADLPAPTPAPAASSLQGMRVLMVEDNPVNMLIAAAMLEGWGVQVAQATDGAQAVQALQEALAAGQLPDAVLMDVQMPVMSGHEATRTLRALPGFAGLPIIALTAAAMVHEREEARAAGMDDFLGKPIDAERLRAALARWRHAGSAQALARGSA
jgi:CheY-like chemotaxis protein